MMAGTGVSVGGTAMLRTRRRDVSVKPNRKLDRKSSRGMIYENEELRLRTIHINAEVEQGQNDIKKLRKENEQLRREIWSLRDEYDKLEEILKRQKSRGESEEYEIRSDEDDGLQSDYSLEEDEEFDEDKTTQDSSKELNKAEQLENAENQKISSEKMTSSLHRLHVDFDDLSVVEEEEELKKEKDKTSSEDGQQLKDEKSPFTFLKPRHLHENIPFYPGTYEPPGLSGPSYYADCPFKFPSTLNLMMAPGVPDVATTCPRLHTEPLLPTLTGGNLDQVNDQILHAPPAGWQSNLIIPQKQMTEYGDVAIPSGLEAFGGIHREDQQRFAPSATGFPNYSGTIQRRNVGLKQSDSPFNATPFENQFNPEKMVVENGWGFDVNLLNLNPLQDQSPSDLRTKDAEGKPKHFFAPLPSKMKKQSEEPSPTVSHFGTGSSSCSGKTESTVVSKSQLMLQKGSADICVNGAVPCEDSIHRNKVEQRTFLSTENLLITDERSNTGNQLMKSMSCQDLPSESQPTSISTEGRPQMMTQSDNTLDNISDSKPYRSHLSVTLKRPQFKQTASPDTPEIPKLPSMDYRLFKNPFLRTFDPTCSYKDQNNVTRPLSVQVNDDNVCYYRPQPNIAPFHQGTQLGARYRPVQPDQNRLLIPSNQLLNGKLASPANKHDIQVTSFEKPSPHTLIGSTTPYELNTLRRLNTNPYLQSQNLYQNMPFVPRGGLYPQRGMMYYNNLTLKVPVQTQTSIDGDSHHEDEQMCSHEESGPSTPAGQRRKKAIRKEKIGLAREQNLSPLAQKRLKKQISVTSSDVPESPGVKVAGKRPRRLSITTTTTSEGQEDKHESRSSSSGQDSPKKDQMRRVSLYFNTKKRPSLTSVKTTRSGSVDISKDKDTAMSSERERTNSISSRDTPSKSRKASTSSGSVPWCACWGNGCI
ncbi:PREDICTED: uncharacterized protein LOC107186235 [Dufourea novaeangliae]|uniref:uncharacterized protein LOC107186235 n=1 Tax=Dufourea novaeangliae TaxID=178035 RepID=UPI0007677302|nr:PREDICTED: uncharacterized protein LOC107186235 [Dufourea novaeangliae]